MNLTPTHAIIIGSIVAPVLLLIGAKIIGQSVWTVLAALGTIAAVIWAVYSQGFLSWYNKPVLQIIPYVETHPHLIKGPIKTLKPSINQTTSEKSLEEKTYERHTLVFNLKNAGKTIGHDARPFVTAVATCNDKDEWSFQGNWAPTPLKWIHEYYDTRVTKTPSKDKHLVPERPYLFELGFFSNLYPDSFRLSWSRILPHQPQDYQKGKYCFEVTAYAVKAKTKKIYVKLEWNGKHPLNKENVKISILYSKPKFWPSR